MKFNYSARTKKGEIQTGAIEAGSREAAVEILHNYDLVVISLEALSDIPFYARSLKFLQRVKSKEMTMFYRQLAILFEANVSPLDSLKILGSQTKNPLFREILFEIEKGVRGGETISKAMSKHPKVFTTFYVNVVSAGEASGKLHEVLNYLADHAEREYNLNHKVKGAFTYPAAIMTMFIVVMILMMVYVIPQLTGMLEEMGQELPLSTKLLIASSNILKSWFWLISLIFIGIAGATWKFLKTPDGRIIFDTIKLKIPIFKTLFQKIYLARFAENLKTLLIGGIPILKSLDITATVIGNKVYEKIIKEAREKVRIGETISSAFSSYPKRVPPMVGQMIGVGEKTAQLDIILEKIAKFYHQDVDRMVSNMTQLIEPIMILVLGAGTAFLLASILMPIYNIGSSL